jgi:hypothetical protein
MNSLPTHVGNDVARVALPIMTAARTNDLAKQLLKGVSGARGEKTGARGADLEEEKPLPNGDSNAQPDLPTTRHTPPATIRDPLPNGDSSGGLLDPSTRNTSPATTNEPIPNGKKMYGKKIKKNTRENQAMESSRSSKVAPLANGKLSDSDRRSHSTPASATAQRSTIHDSRPTTEQPLPNRKSARAKPTKNRHKEAKPRKLQALPMS